MLRSTFAALAAAVGSLLVVAPAHASCTLPSSSYTVTKTFVDSPGVGSTSMTIAYDGSNYWTSSGGSSSGTRLGRFTTGGSWVSGYAAGRDFRSVFTKGDGIAPIYQREYNDRLIDVMSSPGVFSGSVTLSGGSLDAQSAVVWDDINDQFVAQYNGRVDVWNGSGTWVKSVSLSGYSGAELTYPQNRGVAAVGGCYITYYGQTISLWNSSGVREDTATLVGAGTGFDSYFSFSYADGMFWVIDSAYGTWRGYDVGTVGCVDADGDGHSSMVCGGDDCNDSLATVYPGAPEVCDSLDNDCDGSVDEGAGCCDDGDGDGFDASYCGGTDCNDSNPSVYPGATEACNGADDDCDGLLDEGLAFTYYFRDTDLDGFGNPDAVLLACAPPAGYVANDDDCDDFDRDVYPGAPEVCDDVDNDCDGRIDDADPDLDPTSGTTWYNDGDGDGYGDPSSYVVACDPPPGDVADGSDCDDADPSVNPGAVEVCSGIDEDCDGLVDDADLSVDPTTFNPWYADADVDGYGDAGVVTWSCDPPVGSIADNADCDDTNGSINPSASEVCDGLDNDCDALTDDADPSLDASTRSDWHPDGDGDGYGSSVVTVAACASPVGHLADNTDCNDGNPAINPAASEVCNGIDDDCDALVDDADADVDASTGASWYADADGDSYGDPAVVVEACAPGAGEVADGSDCDDGNAGVNPGATEVCNGYDDDCDALIDDSDPSVDEGSGATWYSDVDGDGYGDLGAAFASCTPPSGTVGDATDCDDRDAAVNPGATEVCNGYDDDCDLLVDDADDSVDASTFGSFYVDADGDGYGDAGATVASCGPLPGSVGDATDCDDGDADINPSADEVCNGFDDDCDELIDDADDSVDGTTFSEWHADADGDGYGDPVVFVMSCNPGSGYVSDDTDCNDADLLVRPGGTEACNDVDDDCDGIVDEDVSYVSWWLDGDGDGFGDPTVAMVDCAPADGFLDNNLDCDDFDALVNPNALEVCNGYDDDCDTLVDDADDSVDASTGVALHADSDGDSYGDAASTTYACAPGGGLTADGSDCDDADGTIYPGAAEVCDGVDEDCDGLIDDGATDAAVWYADSDGDSYGDPLVPGAACAAPDGYVGDFTDCDDADPATYPGAPEVAYDGIDQDCDGFDSDDLDGDGYSGWSAGGTDCVDRDDGIYPGAPEVENGIDDDCDGVVDEGTDGSDDDGDGFTEHGGDCDDADGGVNPAADEACDGVDEDCDGVVDEGTTCFDDDGDGYAEEGGDCVDGDAGVYPGGKEIPDNGIDDDCDGVVDAGAVDADGDGYSEAGGDCDEGRGDVHPGAPELEDGRDNDCDGLVDEGTDAYDDDGDGFSEGDGDCDDDRTTTYPGAPEVLGNGIDDDCDGLVDEGTDGYDDDDDGYSEDAGDCDDGDPTIYPGAPETANGRDDDCDGVADEGTSDVDSDGVSVEQGDCDDFDGWVNPQASELCDGVDNDCDGQADEDCGVEDETGLTADTGEGDSKGCGCATGGGSGVGAGVLFLIAALARRRAA